MNISNYNFGFKIALSKCK